MKAQSLFRIASILVFLFALGHSLGYPWVGEVTAAQLGQIEALRAVTAPIQGFERSYWDFHVGFGVTISVFFLLQAIIFWRLGASAATESNTARFAAMLFAVFYVTCTAVNFLYFFWAPIILSALLAICLGAAAMRVSRPSRAR